MSAIDGLSSQNYNSFLISGNSAIKKSDQIYPNGATNALTEVPKSTKSTGSTTLDEFKKYMEMTPAEKVRYGVLNQLGITEEQLAAMPPEQREAMEKKIADMIAIRTGGTDQNSLAVQQGQNAMANNTDVFKMVQAGARAAMPLINVFS